MSIERLSALEKDLREEERQQLAESRRHASEGNDETVQAFCNGKAFGLNSAAQRIANIIAELGQEVGAVAPVSFAVELADGTLGALGWIDYAKFEHVKNMGTLANGARYVFAYRTSPAHTSEARDAEVAELIEATRRLTADIEFRIDDPRSQLLDRARRATTAAVGCNCPGSARVSYLSHAPNCPAREALGKFAAMRQEGGNG